MCSSLSSLVSLSLRPSPSLGLVVPVPLGDLGALGGVQGDEGEAGLVGEDREVGDEFEGLHPY